MTGLIVFFFGRVAHLRVHHDTDDRLRKRALESQRRRSQEKRKSEKKHPTDDNGQERSVASLRQALFVRRVSKPTGTYRRRDHRERRHVRRYVRRSLGHRHVPAGRDEEDRYVGLSRQALRQALLRTGRSRRGGAPLSPHPKPMRVRASRETVVPEARFVRRRASYRSSGLPKAVERRAHVRRLCAYARKVCSSDAPRPRPSHEALQSSTQPADEIGRRERQDDVAA